MQTRLKLIKEKTKQLVDVIAELGDLITKEARDKNQNEKFQEWVKCNAMLLNINLAPNQIAAHDPTQQTQTPKSQIDDVDMSMWIDEIWQSWRRCSSAQQRAVNK